jgi:hypothetical protein
LIASLPSVGVCETGFWHALQMLGRSESSELAAARLRLGRETTLVPRRLQIVGHGARGDGCPAQDTDSSRCPVRFGRRTRTWLNRPSMRCRRGMQPETGQNARFTAAG